MPKSLICDVCEYPYDSWAIDPARKGKVFECSCGSKHITGNRIQTRVYHIICRKDKISAEKSKRKYGVWAVEKTADGLSLFVTCPSCARINTVGAEEIDKDGYVGGKHENSCIECNCGYHFWPFLEGWTDERKKLRSHHVR